MFASKITDELLINTYQSALNLELDEEFILLLKEEVIRRGMA
jgi:hypothetical protein